MAQSYLSVEDLVQKAKDVFQKEYGLDNFSDLLIKVALKPWKNCIPRSNLLEKTNQLIRQGWLFQENSLKIFQIF